MKDIRLLIAAAVVFVFASLAGCSSSKPSSEGAAQNPPPQPPVTQQPEVRHDRADTLDVQTQDKQQPSYQPQTNTPPVSQPRSTTSASGGSGTFTVQAGAYKSQDAADRIAQLAKERFGRGVSTSYDATTNLYKVMVGSFLTKDDARSFRDEMVRKYPLDYKDAWVSEHTQ